MTKDHRIDEFRFNGEDIPDWPAWLRFMNFATDKDRTVIILHYLSGKVMIKRGDLIVRYATGEVLPDVSLLPEDMLHPDAKTDK